MRASPPGTRTGPRCHRPGTGPAPGGAWSPTSGARGTTGCLRGEEC